jgi:hypothetical protein
MNLSYNKVINFINENKKILIFAQVFTLILGSAYFAFSPKVYEAYFEINIAKMEIQNAADSGVRSRWEPVTSGRDLRWVLQAPMSYPKELVEKCFGVDTNLNRKHLVNSTQLGVANSGYVLSVAMRLEGLGNSSNCADAYGKYIIDILNLSLDDRLKNNAQIHSSLSANKILQSNKATFLIPVRMADGYVRPDKLRVIVLSLLLGFVVAFSIIALNEKYRAK